MTSNIAHVNLISHTSEANTPIKSESPRDIKIFHPMKHLLYLFWPGSHRLQDSWNNKSLFMSKHSQKGSSVLEGMMRQSCLNMATFAQEWKTLVHLGPNSNTVTKSTSPTGSTTCATTARPESNPCWQPHANKHLQNPAYVYEYRLASSKPEQFATLFSDVFRA